MQAIANTSLGDVVSFNLHQTNVLPIKYENVKLLGVLDFNTVKDFIDPLALHAAMYPSLPEGTLNDPKKYYYLKIKYTNGGYGYIGIPWIKLDSVKVIGSGTLTITIENASPDTLNTAVAALSSNGLKVSTVNLE